MAADIATLYGIDPEAAEKLKAEGIETIEQFYDVAKYPDSRAELSRGCVQARRVVLGGGQLHHDVQLRVVTR